MIESSICKEMSITIFLIGAYITCITSFFWVRTWYILLLEMDIFLLYSPFRPCYQSYIPNAGILIKNV